MRIIFLPAGIFLILLVLIDGFEVIVQSRRVTHRFRYVRLFFRASWTVWRSIALRIRPGKRRESFLSVFGPLFILLLFMNWVVGMIVGFAVVHWSVGTAIHAPESPGFWTYLYLSGTTFFTVGYGDVTPLMTPGRMLCIIEGGLGFGFLAVIISYLPVLYQASSRREVTISLLDARAGSPPSAGQLLLRIARSGDITHIDAFLRGWEEWSAELLESNLSFPVLTYYRSQHDNQSWLAALTMMLDACAFLLSHVQWRNAYQAQLTFAMARHAAVDLSLVLKVPPQMPVEDRLPPARLQQLRRELTQAGLALGQEGAPEAKLAELRGMYEPFVAALARRFLFTLPEFASMDSVADNWQRSAWMQQTPGIGELPVRHAGDEHFT